MTVPVPAGADALSAAGSAGTVGSARLPRAALTGVAAVAAAALVGVVVAALLRWWELGPTPFWRAGLWLAGLGLGGAWRQDVDAVTLDPTSWQTAASGAPLWVTIAAITLVWRVARTGTRPAAMTRADGRDGGAEVGPAVAGALVAGVAAGAAAWLLAAGSQHEVLVANSAGAVTTRDGLALWWAEAGRLGVVPAAALLVGLVWLAAVLVHDVRWHEAWRDVLAVLLVPGVVLTVLAGVGLWWLLSGWSIPVATWLLLPLLGTELLLVAAGVPVSVAVPRLTAGPVEWSTWSQGAAVALAGLGVAVLWAVAAGAWRARRRDPGVPTAVAAAVSGAGCGLFAMALAAAGPSASFPAGLGGEGMLSVPPLAAGLAGLGLGVLSVLLGTPLGRRRGRPERMGQDGAEGRT